MKNLTQREALELIEMIVFDDISIHTDPQKMVDIIGQVYQVAHAHNKKHSCYHVHKGWRKSDAKNYPEMKKLIMGD